MWSALVPSITNPVDRMFARLSTLRGSKRPLLPQSPLENVVGVAPHLFEWVFAEGRAACTSEIGDFRPGPAPILKYDPEHLWVPLQLAEVTAEDTARAEPKSACGRQRPVLDLRVGQKESKIRPTPKELSKHMHIGPSPLRLGT